MFYNPFSFDGRIRRTEYAISLVITFFAVTIARAIASIFISVSPIIALIVLLGLYFFIGWFIFAQGAKRCHDIDKSGWFQLIPILSFLIVFEDSKPGKNKYGDHPKGSDDPGIKIKEKEEGSILTDEDNEMQYECIHCGYTQTNNFDFCPKCGKNDDGYTASQKK